VSIMNVALPAAFVSYLGYWEWLARASTFEERSTLTIAS